MFEAIRHGCARREGRERVGLGEGKRVGKRQHERERSRVGTVLPFSVFFGFRVFPFFIRVLGRVFGPDLLR